MAELFANDVATTLAAPVTDAVGTSLSVVSSAGFPAPGAGDQFRIRIDNELLAVTAVAGTTWTVTRGIEGTTAATHAAAAQVTHVITAGAMAGMVAKAGDTMTGPLTVPSLVMPPTVGTAKGRFGGLPGIEAWVGMFVNAAFNGSAWVLDDTAKSGWFFKLDSRAGLSEFAVYRIPSGANPHTDEAALFRVSDTGVVTVANRVTGVSNATGATDAVPKGQADGAYSAIGHTHAAADGTPPGAMLMYGGAAAPAGYLMCDGAAVSRTTYAALFTALGGASSPHGLGDGSTTFNVPDMRVRVPVGAGTGKALGSTDGVAEASRNSYRTHSHGHGASFYGTGTGYASIASVTSDTSSSAYTATDGSHSHGLTMVANDLTTTVVSNTTTTGGGARITALGGLTAGSHSHSGSAVTSASSTHSHLMAHTHGVAVSDSGHSHTTSGSVSGNTTPESPFTAVNYIIKT
jgi:microcystin-dependent protein